MTTVYNDPEIGNIEFSYSALTERSKVIINGVQATRINKRTLKVDMPEETYEIHITGNVFSGIKFSCKEKVFVVTEKAPWYVYVLGIIPFVMTLVLGTIPTLPKAGFYYVGGAIGGGISGALSAIGIFLAAFSKKHIYRLLILFGIIVLTFLVCWGIGNAIVSISNSK